MIIPHDHPRGYSIVSLRRMGILSKGIPYTMSQCTLSLMPRGSSALAAVETEIVERPLRGDVPSTGYLYCIYNSMQGDLDKNTRHVRGLDRSRHTESEETPMESTRPYL